MFYYDEDEDEETILVNFDDAAGSEFETHIPVLFDGCQLVIQRKDTIWGEYDGCCELYVEKIVTDEEQNSTDTYSALIVFAPHVGKVYFYYISYVDGSLAEEYAVSYRESEY